MHIFDFFRHIFSFLVPLVVFLGVKLIFENPASVKEMTNMRYAPWVLKGPISAGSNRVKKIISFLFYSTSQSCYKREKNPFGHYRFGVC